MTEEDARLALLQTELNSIQGGIRGLDTITFQIKGWCVTAALAVGGYALAHHEPALVIAGTAAVLGFFLVDCQFKTFQRTFIDLNKAIDKELKDTGIMEYLKGNGKLKIVGTAPAELDGTPVSDVLFGAMLRALWREARLAHTFGLYFFMFVCLWAEAIVLVASYPQGKGAALTLGLAGLFIVSGLVGLGIGSRKGRPFLGLMLGLLFSLIGIIITAALPKATPATSQAGTRAGPIPATDPSA